MKKCVSCSSDRFVHMADADGIFSRVKIMQCKNCRLSFQDPMPSSKRLADFYRDFYGDKEYVNAKGLESYPEEMYLKKNAKKENKKIKEIESLVKKGKILDIGVGKGFFISELAKKKNWGVYGIEYSKPVAKEVKKRYGLNVEPGEITGNSFRNIRFDVITMQSTLEHIPNQKETLIAVNKKLKKGGFFIFNVPNIKSFEFYIYKMLGREFPGFIRQHLFFYTPTSVKKLLNTNGFKIVKMTSKHPESPSLPPIRPLIGIMNYLPKLLFEYTSLFGKCNFGNTLFVYAKKVREIKSDAKK